ncbi:2-haloacid dehalogenase [uncultured bacterium]|nr:2-haloacid dehalogenase [uncultured bacterium]
MNKRYQAVIFDLGGVLVNWDPRHLYGRFFNDDVAAMEQFLTEINFHAWNLEQDRGRSFADGVAELSAQLPQYADLIRAYDQHWEDSITGQIDGTVDLLQSLRAAGYTVGLLSNISTEKYDVLRRKYRFFEYFDSQLISADVKLLKPDPRIYALMLEQIDRAADECIFVDDSAVNVAGADRVGMTAIQFQSPHQLKIELQQRGVLS